MGAWPDVGTDVQSRASKLQCPQRSPENFRLSSDGGASLRWWESLERGWMDRGRVWRPLLSRSVGVLAVKLDRERINTRFKD